MEGEYCKDLSKRIVLARNSGVGLEIFQKKRDDRSDTNSGMCSSSFFLFGCDNMSKSVNIVR